MPVKPDSRYARQPLIRAIAPDGSVRIVLALPILQRPTLAVQTRHRVTQGEQPDAIAKRYFGDERLWWRVLDANPLIHPLDLEPGQVLDIPAQGPTTRVTRARSF